MDILDDIVARVTRYTSRTPISTDTIWRDLGIGCEGFVEFCDELQSTYGIDPHPLFEDEGTFKDATVAAVAAYLSARRTLN